MDELDLIHKINQPPFEHQSLILGAGDDCALLKPSSKEMLITSDTLLDGTHFDTRTQPISKIINKLFAVNCSDIYAMGGVPTTAILNLSLPKKFHDSESMVKAIKSAAKKYEVAIIGGDTNIWEGKLVLSMTLMGEPINAPILRSGAKRGDIIYTTGPLGGSLESGRHLTPPNTKIKMKSLLKHVRITSMIDLSDGLATDLKHILSRSGVGAIITKSADIIHKDAKTFEDAMVNGEDFELCFTVSSQDSDLLKSLGLVESLGLIRVGTITDSKKLLLQDRNNISDFNLSGYQHRSL